MWVLSSLAGPGPVPRMDVRHEGGGSRRPTRNSQLLQELHRIVLKCAFQGRRYIHGCRVGCAQAGSFSERWRGWRGSRGQVGSCGARSTSSAGIRKMWTWFPHEEVRMAISRRHEKVCRTVHGVGFWFVRQVQPIPPDGPSLPLPLPLPP